MAVNLSPIGGVAGQFFTNNGTPLSGGKIYTYAAGSSTPAATYTSASGGTAHTNPIVLDSGGRVPTGEIWLTDGVSYKFVIKTSADVLIGTYDNIIGINSNFVNYTNSQEIQTATAGQTLFTLTGMAYAPGTNSLSVFVDGVNQYGPGAQYAYVETSSTEVTFTNGLHVGAEVKFTTSQLNSSAGGDASQVSYLPAGTGAVATNVQAKLRQTVSVMDFGAVGDGVTDDTAAIQEAFNTGHEVFIPKGTYKTTSTLYITTGNVVGEGVTFTHPFWIDPNMGSLDGVIFKPVGLQDSAVISVIDKIGNGVSISNFGIDMSEMGAGTNSGNFDVSSMTKGIYIKDRYGVSFSNIEIINVPSNSAGVVFHSTLTGDGLFWGGISEVGVRTKLSVSDDPTAKGFVLFGDTQVITALTFSNCVSYRGWYATKLDTCQFIACDAENNPKDGLYLDNCRNVTIIGGFYEDQGTEDSSRTYYNIYAVNGCKKISVTNATMAGNGFGGTMTGFDGLSIIGSGVFGQSYDDAVQSFGTMLIDGAGNVTAPNNSGVLAYLKSFNSTVPPSTPQAIYFDKTQDGYDIAHEYDDTSTGQWVPRQANAALGYSKGQFLVSIQLKIVKQGGGNLDAGSQYLFQLGGGGYTSSGSLSAVSSGQDTVFLSGVIPLRLSGGSSAYTQFTFTHTNSSSVVIENNSGAAGSSWFSISRVA